MKNKIYLLSILIIFFSCMVRAQSDLCSSATPIAVTTNCSSPVSGTTAGATQQTITGCVGTADDDVWYQFVATNTSHTITVVGSPSFDAVVQLFSGTCSSLTSLACQHLTFTGGTETIYSSGLTIGATYLIRIYHYSSGSGSGNFTLCVATPPPAPLNDNCAVASTLSVNSSCTYTSSTTVGGTPSSLTGCSGSADDDVWFKFVATNSVQTITVDPSASMDAVVQVFSGTCSALNTLYCQDVAFSNGNEVINAVGLISGNTYYIRVFDYYSSNGGAPFQICITGPGTSAPTNDDPCSAIALPALTSACNYLAFTTTGSSASMGAPTPASCVGGSGAMIGGFTASSHDVWFSIVVPSSGSVFVTPQPNYGITDAVMSLYSGTCSALSQIACSDDNNYPGTTNDAKPYISANGLTPGTTVYLRYWGFGTSSGNFGICASSPSNDNCANALYICDLNGYSASTSAAYTPDRPSNMYGNNELANGTNMPDGTNTGGPFGGSTYDVVINNNSWITFTAAATTATLNVSIYDCWVGNFPSGGIQMEIFSGTNCANFVSVSNFEESSTGFVITASNLTVGQNYYLVIDGYAGDICNYTITANSGVQFPNITASPNPICYGTSTTLTAPPGAVSYLWSPGGATTPSITVTPSTTTTYTCVVGGVCDFKQTLTKTITVNQLPVLTNSQTSSSCSGQNVNIVLTSSLSSTYNWVAANNPNTIGESTTFSTNSTINDVIINNTLTPQNVTYIVTPTSTDGCVGSSSNIVVTINPLPSMTNNNTERICEGDQLNIALTSTLTSTYSWIATNNINTAGESTILQTGSTINDIIINNSSVPEIITYTVTPTSSSGGCAGTTQTITVTVNPVPTMTSSSIAAICENSALNIVLTSDISSSYTWIAANNTNTAGESTSLQTGNIINDIITNNSLIPQTIIYTVTPSSTLAGCTGSSQLVIVTINPLPNANAGKDIIINCLNTTDVFSALGGGSYSWNTPAGNVSGQSININSSNAPGNYIVTVTEYGCSDKDTALLSVTITPPNANAGANQTFTCAAGTLTLNGSSTTSGVQFSWSGPFIASGVNSANPTITGAGIYTVTVTDTSNGCTSTSSVTIIPDSNAPLINVDTSSATITCAITSVQLDGTGSATGSNIIYNWTTTNGNIVSGATTTTPTVNANGTYTLTVTNTTNSCSSQAIVTVGIDTVAPIVVIDLPDTLHCNLDSLNINAINSVFFPGAQFNWNTNNGIILSGDTTTTVTVGSAGSYSFTITNPNGCSSTDSVQVIEAQNPIASFTPSPTSGVVPLVVNFSNSSSGNNLSYYWDFGNGTTSTLLNPSNTYQQEGIDSVLLIVTDGNGCTDTAIAFIDIQGLYIIVIPNIFSPNTDGNNDLFYPTLKNAIAIKANIYNRWGQHIYQWDKLLGGWDGFSQSGIEAPEGTYYYFFSVTDFAKKTHEYKGYFVLIR